MIFISPQPNVWYDIYLSLEEHWKAELKARYAPPPPKSLILSSWTMSSDLDKQYRWKTTVMWAETYGCSELIPKLTHEQEYRVEKISDYRPYQYYDYETKKRPSPEAEREAFEKLKAQWSVLLTDEFGLNTEPIRFSGNKRRSLLVKYESEYIPPWGSWNDHLANGRPSLFTTLRQKVNQVIAPHGVDHIHFEEKD